MSNPTPRPASPADPTQHQLDELEALMQRMLALPVNQLDDDPASVAALPPLAPLPEWESAPSLETLGERGCVSAPSAEHQEIGERGCVSAPSAEHQEIGERGCVSAPSAEHQEIGERGCVSAPSAEHQEIGVSAPSADNEPESEPVAAAERMIPVLRAPIVVRPVEIEPKPPTAATNKYSKPPILPARGIGRPLRDRPGLGMRLLLWSNRAFDHRVGRWGAVGRWLRGRFGRALLGLTGLLLLMAGLVLGVLDWIGWTW